MRGSALHVCGRGSSHVLRPSAPPSILVGALARGGPTRVTGKQQSASCERACSGKKKKERKEKKFLHFLPRTMASVLHTSCPFLCSRSESHAGAPVHGPQTIFTMKMFLLARPVVCLSRWVLGEKFKQCEMTHKRCHGPI